MNWTMEKLKKMEEREYPTLMRVLFGLESPTSVSQDLDDLSEELRNLDFIDPMLNDSQRDAVKFALASREVALIHGPPGVSLDQSLIQYLADCWSRQARPTPSSSSSSSLSNAPSAFLSVAHPISQSTT